MKLAHKLSRQVHLLVSNICWMIWTSTQHNNILHTAARLLTSTRCNDHITPVDASAALAAGLEMSRVQYCMSCTPAPTYFASTFNSSPSTVDHINAPLPTGHWLFRGCVSVLVTAVSLLQDALVYRLICNRWSAMDNLGDIWKHVHFRFRNHSPSWLWFFTVQKYAYLLTCSILTLSLAA